MAEELTNQQTSRAEASDGSGSSAHDPGALDLRPGHSVRAVLDLTVFRRLWLALGLSSLGDWLGLLAITALASKIAEGESGKYFAVSGVFILRLAPAVLLGPVAGVLVDRFSRRWILVFGDVLRFLLFASIPLVGTLWWLLVATALVEIVGIFWLPAKDAAVPTLVPAHRLEAAHQLSLAVTYGSAPVAAILFAGLTLLNGMLDGVIPHLAQSQAYLALYVNAATFAVSAVVIWSLDLPVGSGASDRQESLWRTGIQGWKYISGTPVVRGLVLGMLGAFAAGGVVISLAKFFVKSLNAGDPGYGLLFAAVFLGLAAGMWLMPRLLPEFPRRRLFGLSIAGAGLWLVLLSAIPSMPLAVFFTFGLGYSAGTAWVTGYTLLGLEVGDEVRGRTFAFVQAMVRVVLITVLAIAPVIAVGLAKLMELPYSWQLNDFVTLTYTGVMATFLLAGVLATAIGVLAYRQMDDRPGVTLRSDIKAVVAQRTNPEVLPQLHYPGRFIAFEGGDGSGKSTQVRLLSQWLAEQGFTVAATREPGGTPAGRELRDILLHGRELSARAEALLFAADRAHHVEIVVTPALVAGQIVVTDRYSDSSIAYQGSGRDLGFSEVAGLSRWAAAGLVPDLTVVLDLDPETAASRTQGPPDRLESAGIEFHGRVRQAFLDLARRAPSRYLVIDAGVGPQEVHLRVRQHLAGVLPESPVLRAARVQAESAQRAAAAAKQAAEAAEQAALVRERERIRAQALAEIRAQKLREQQARLERAAIEASARAEQERNRRLRAAQPTASVSAPPLPKTAPLPQVGLATATARPKARSAKPAVAPKLAAASLPPEPEGADAQTATKSRPSLDDEIFGLGRDLR